MTETNNIQYIHDKAAGIELILAGNSLISYPLHNHVSAVILGLVLGGSIYLTLGGSSFACAPGSSFTILPYSPHIITASGPYSLLTLCIDKNALRQYGKDETRNNIRNLLAAVREPKLTERQISRLLNFPETLADAPTPYPAETFIDRARNQIERRPEAKLSVDEMARALYISKYHFIRSFKQAVGLTPHQFQIQNRVRKAQRMLNNAAAITEAALAAGFCDQSHFIKHFEKYLGLTPTAYKNACHAR